MERTAQGWAIPKRLTDAQRTKILSRLDELGRLIDTPDDVQRLKVALGVLLVSLPSGSSDEISIEGRVGGYRIALQDLPTWAVTEAVRAYLKGEAGDGRWCPTPPQLANAARAQQEAVVAESNALRRLLNARVEDEPRERVSAERVQALLSTFGVKMEEAS